MAEDWAARGREIQRQLWGESSASAERPALPAAEVAPEYFDLVRESCFGMFWSRPGLAVRDRSLVTVAVLAAMGKPEELAAHLHGARNVGLSQEELVEALMHVGVYAGVPTGVNALKVAASVFTPKAPPAET
ncbi:MAG: carboxymuconolactone decarboxylase family protein [Acidimicrobiaceae bacterium]|nr:carboxymuconolactone decarboxylase family protein [Acidimicrobiaceae bacterium]